MEEGFEEVNQLSCIRCSSKSKLYLFRIPKDIDVSHLNGMKVKLSSLNDSDNIGSYSVHGIIHELHKDTTYPTIRPIVTDSVVGDYVLGPQFTKGVTICKNFTSSFIESQRMKENTPNQLPISYASKYVYAYEKLDQISDLSIRTLPQGSLSTIEELKERLDQSNMISISKRKRSISFDKSNTRQTTFSQNNNNHNDNDNSITPFVHDRKMTDKKKSKKEKKEKKKEKQKEKGEEKREKHISM